MSAPGGTTGTGIPNPTRQQLDELENFLQQMLGLPLDPSPGDSPAPERPQTQPPIRWWRPYTPPAPSTEADPTNQPASAINVARDEGRLVPVGLSPSHEATVPTSNFDEVVFSQESARDEMPPFVERISHERAASPSVPGWLWPIVAINRAFDAPTHAMGGIGRWLRSDEGRAILGWIGLALLTMATVWVVLDLLSWM